MCSYSISDMVRWRQTHGASIRSWEKPTPFDLCCACYTAVGQIRRCGKGFVPGIWYRPKWCCVRWVWLQSLVILGFDRLAMGLLGCLMAAANDYIRYTKLLYSFTEAMVWRTSNFKPSRFTCAASSRFRHALSQQITNCMFRNGWSVFCILFCWTDLNHWGRNGVHHFCLQDSFTGTKTGKALIGCADRFSANQHEPAQSGEPV